MWAPKAGEEVALAINVRVGGDVAYVHDPTNEYVLNNPGRTRMVPFNPTIHKLCTGCTKGL